MGRTRNADRRKWPPGLTARTSSTGTVYYTYRGKLAPKETYLGSDLDAAIKAVDIVMRTKAPEPVQAVIAKLDRPASTVLAHSTWYKTRLEDKRGPTKRPLSPQTLYEYKRIVDDFTERLKPSRSIADPTPRDVAAILESLPAWTSNRYRQIMAEYFVHAVARGFRPDNPALNTVRRDTSRTRRRLPLEHFQSIHKHADPWFQRLLALAFWSLQRVGDLVLLRADEHWSDGVLRVRQAKGRRHGTGLLAIKPGEQLLAAIVACLNSPERSHDDYGTCPYLVHRAPLKNNAAEWKLHPLQISSDLASREFTRMRDEVLKLYADVDEAERPSFHEIRALGADHYLEVLKWPEDKVQALLGHTSLKMTRVYLDGHGDRWTEVAAG